MESSFDVVSAGGGLAGLTLARQLHFEAPHVRRDHLPKLGLRYFFPHESNRDVAARVELGTGVFPPVPSFQLDRGRLENSLLTLARESGASVLDGCTVREIDLGDTDHRVVVDTVDGRRTVTARWIVDSSGRAGLSEGR